MVTDMLGGALLGLVAMLAPALTCAASERRRQLSPSAHSCVAVGTLSYFISSALLHKVSTGEAYTYALAVGFGCALAWGFGLIARNHPASSSNLHEAIPALPAAAFAAGLATLGCADIVLALGAQSWGAEGQPTHFHGLQLDPVRNTVISVALHRGMDSAFWPDSRFVYQLLWYHGAARVLDVLPQAPSRFHQVMGMTVATAWILYFCLASVVISLHRNLTKFVPILVLASLLFITEGPLTNSHVIMINLRDIFPSALTSDANAFFKYLRTEPPYFRYMSLKLFALTAPQHLLFSILFLGAVLDHARDQGVPAHKFPRWAILFSGAGLASPILTLLIVPIYMLLAASVRVEPVKAYLRLARDGLVIALTVILLHRVAMRFDLWDLFLRPSVASFSRIWREGLPPVPVWQLFLSLAASTGIPGLLAMALAPVWVTKRHLLRTASAEKRAIIILTSAALIGFLFWNFVYSDTEVRRHYSFILSLCLTLAVVSSVISFVRFRGLLRAYVLSLVLVTGLYGSSYSLWQAKNFAFSASTVATDIPWQDYFCANQYLAQRVGATAVLAASGEGIVIPLAAEVAITLVPRLAIFAHQKLSALQLETPGLKQDFGPWTDKNMSDESIAGLVRAGFNVLVWGPVEASAWSGLKNSFRSRGRLVATCGEVGVYEMEATIRSAPEDSTEQQKSSAQIDFERFVDRAFETRQARRN